jgi:hypothetical protein
MKIGQDRKTNDHDGNSDSSNQSDDWECSVNEKEIEDKIRESLTSRLPSELNGSREGSHALTDHLLPAAAVAPAPPAKPTAAEADWRNEKQPEWLPRVNPKMGRKSIFNPFCSETTTFFFF